MGIWNRALPSTDNLKSLSALYGVPVDYLLNSDTEEQRVTKGLEAENIPMNGKRTKRNLWVVLSIVMIVLLLVACEIFLYVNKQEEGVDLHSIAGEDVTLQETPEFDLNFG